VEVRPRWIWGLLVAGILLGCSPSPEESSGTGAKECVQEFYEALIQQDWPRAYAVLDPQAQKRLGSLQFNRLGLAYRNSLGFEPQAIHVRACEERGTEATAHVVLTGRTIKQEHRYKDAITLRQGEQGWRVQLPPHFGGTKKW
jgi:hypothetical protein